MTAARPVPAPNQPGSMCRLCDQANIQGTARIVSTPLPPPRTSGREPICMRSITSTGVTAWKNSKKPRVVVHEAAVARPARVRQQLHRRPPSRA